MLRYGSLVLALLASGCTKAAPDGTGAAAGVSDAAAAVTSDAARLCAEFEAQPAAPGSIEGLIVFDGMAPARMPINTAAEGGCGLDPKEPALTEAWVVEGGRMANVFVWLVNPPAEDDVGPFETLSLDQRGCVYRPHAIGLRVGQTLRISNADRARHNVHTLPRRDANPSINQTQAEGAPPLELTFGEPEVAVPIVCDLHPWMKAWVGVFAHHYFAVTGADGRFAWSGLPPGEYTLNAWHEVLGKLSGRAVVSEGGGARVCITFARKP